MINLKIVAVLLSAGLAAFGGDAYVEHKDAIAVHAASVQQEIKAAQEKTKNRKDAFMESHPSSNSDGSGIVSLESNTFQQYSPYEDIFAENEDPDDTYMEYPAYTQPMHLAPPGHRGASFADSPYTFAVTTPSYVTGYELDMVLAGTGLAGLGNAYAAAEQMYGINALFLAAITALESGWGGSVIAGDKNNIAGYGAYDSSPYESAWSFRTREDCIMQVARSLAKEYVNPAGAYYHGNTIAAINICYSTSSAWKNKVFRIINELSGKINLLS